VNKFNFNVQDSRKVDQLHTDIQERFSWSALLLIAQMVHKSKMVGKDKCKTDSLLEAIVTTDLKARDLGSVVMRRALVRILYPIVKIKRGKYRRRVRRNGLVMRRVRREMEEMQERVELQLELPEKPKGYLRFEDFEETETVPESTDSIKLDLVRCVLEVLWWGQIKPRIVPLKKRFENTKIWLITYPFFPTELVSGEELWSPGLYYTPIAEAAEVLGRRVKQEQVFKAKIDISNQEALIADLKKSLARYEYVRIPRESNLIFLEEIYRILDLAISIAEELGAKRLGTGHIALCFTGRVWEQI
jgi:hypothetical protein